MGVVVGILVVSFAIWGIGDIFRGFGRSTVAKVGDTEVTVEQFRQIYNERIQQISQQAGRVISADQSRALGLDRQIIGQVVADAALDQYARRLGLGVTDQAIAQQIREIPAFQGLNGQFDPRLFEQRIRSAGYNEQRFVAEQRRFTIRNQLSSSVSGIAAPPKTMLEALNRFQNERRSIEYVTLGAAQVGEIPPTTPEELAKFFESRKASFRAPEYRKLVVLPLLSTDVARWMQISDEDAKKYYESRRDRYVTPGRRQLSQIIFPSAEEAKAAKDRIAGGTTFEAVASERGLSEKDIDLGFVARSAALAPAVAEAAFSLGEGAVSEPVQSRVGMALIKVVKVEPDRVKTYEEAANEIKQEMARDRTRTEINEKHDRVEDERASGQTLAELAQKVGLTATTIEAVDRNGRDPSGAPALGLPTEADVLALAFATDVGVEADAIRVGDGGYVWVDVAGVTPSRERTLEEVKDQVADRWRDEQVAERLRAKATEMVEKLKAGGTLAELAGANGLTVETASGLNRNQRDTFSPATVDAVFRTPKDGAGSAEGSTGTERVVFQVTDVSTPAMDTAAPEAKRIQDTVLNGIAGDLLGQYIAQVQRDLGASINQDAVRRVVGGETN